MGAGLLCNENRHACLDAVFSCHDISRSIGSDGKFSHREGIMMEQHIFLNITAVFLFLLIVAAGVIPDHAIPESEGQIPVK